MTVIKNKPLAMGIVNEYQFNKMSFWSLKLDAFESLLNIPIWSINILDICRYSVVTLSLHSKFS